MRKKKVTPKLVILEFYHPNDRINFFTVEHILKPMISSNELRFYIYESSGIGKNGYTPYHNLKLYNDEVNRAIDVLRNEGWICGNPRPI